MAAFAEILTGAAWRYVPFGQTQRQSCVRWVACRQEILLPGEDFALGYRRGKRWDCAPDGWRMQVFL